MPQVSVIIPCYNHGRYVGGAVDSVLAQTFRDFEIFVVNDGSTEPETVELLRNFRAERTRVVHKENGHRSSARNFGIARSESEFLLTLDAGDRLAPRFLEKTVAVLEEQPDVGMVTCPARTFGMPPEKYIPNPGGDVTSFVVSNGCQASCLFRRRCWEEAGGYDESMKEGYEDWDFHLAVTERGWRIASVPEVLFHCRVAASRMAAEADRRRSKRVEGIVDKHRETFEQHAEVAIVERERRIQDLREEIDRVRGSLSYRLGRCLTQPVSAVRYAVRRCLGGRDG